MECYTGECHYQKYPLKNQCAGDMPQNSVLSLVPFI